MEPISNRQALSDDVTNFSSIDYRPLVKNGQIAQLVEQRIEDPCVAGSIPALATIFNK
jgi:hypothetical protein